MDSSEHREIIRQWLIKADNDLKIVEREFTLPEDTITDILCFHCQQAVEKYLKAFLVSKLIKPPKTHSVAILINECSKIEPLFHTLSDLAYLTEYATELRYPDDFYIPSLAETKKAYADALRAKQFVIDRIQV